MVKSHTDLIHVVGSIGGKRMREKGIWDNFYFLAWGGDPDLAREKSWERSLVIDKFSWRYL